MRSAGSAVVMLLLQPRWVNGSKTHLAPIQRSRRSEWAERSRKNVPRPAATPGRNVSSPKNAVVGAPAVAFDVERRTVVADPVNGAGIRRLGSEPQARRTVNDRIKR